jgi:glyoxylase-like metal-dependent hydrolase (beta-lactamase superfamily II)/rhodanese-related sulfurtransferase
MMTTERTLAPPSPDAAERRLHAHHSAVPLLVEQWNPGGEPSNTYLLADAVSGAAAIIDPVEALGASYLGRLAARGLHLVAIVETHTHADRVSGAPSLARATGAPLVMHHQAPRACVSRRVHHGDEIAVGALRVRVLATPGHTYDSLSLHAGDALFSGDLLALGPRGHAGELCGDADAAHDSLRALSALPDATLTYGAHGGPERLDGALARALAGGSDEPATTARSRLGDEIRMPADPAALAILQANLSCVGAAPGLAGGAEADEIPRLSPDALALALRGERPPFVIDVRSPDEFFDAPLGRIPGALLVPLEHLDAEVESLRVLAGPLVISCRTTARALVGASLLHRAGLPEVAVLLGGIVAWQATGHPIEREA